MYPRFTSFVGALACESVVLAITLSRGNDLYGIVWTITRLIVLLFELLAVVEIFSHCADSFPGIESVGRKLFVTLFSGGLLLAVATSAIDKKWSGWGLAINIVFVVNREIHLWLAAFLLLTVVFFAYYGAPLAPNVRRHIWVMFTLLASTASAYLITARVHNIQVTNILLQVISLGCLSVWLVAFRIGEDVREPAVVSPGDRQDMRAAEALNERLLVLGKRITLRSLLGLAPKARTSGD